MAAGTEKPLDLKRLHNYLLYCVGIGVESVAVLLLMLLGFLICLGLSFF
jgi:hypothetical protein